VNFFYEKLEDNLYKCKVCGRLRSQADKKGFTSIAPLLEEDDFGAEAHIDFIEATLDVYGKRISDISFFVGDNCNVNHCIANIAQKPLIGCYSHKFNLAVEEYLMKYENILDKVHILMVKLRNIKNRGKLRKLQCPYQPKEILEKKRS